MKVFIHFVLLAFNCTAERASMLHGRSDSIHECTDSGRIQSSSVSLLKPDTAKGGLERESAEPPPKPSL